MPQSMEGSTVKKSCGTVAKLLFWDQQYDISNAIKWSYGSWALPIEGFDV
jgi:hypothetical protein